MTIKTRNGGKTTAARRPAPMTEFKRPDAGTADSGRLMDLQDTEHKGDGSVSVEATREPRVLVGFKMPVSLKQELKVRSARTGKTMAELLVEGARMRLAYKD